jgi:hypothetical protein
MEEISRFVEENTDAEIVDEPSRSVDAAPVYAKIYFS